jgi:two-component system response regulator ChvI
MSKDRDNKSKRILLVDDEPDVIYAIKKVLESMGFTVDSYGDPIFALTNFKPGMYDLLVLDIKMPNMNGFDLYERMKKIDRNVKTCFITASELFYEEYRKLGIHASLEKEYFIQKPCKSEELIRQLNDILYS